MVSGSEPSHEAGGVSVAIEGDAPDEALEADVAGGEKVAPEGPAV